MLAIARRLSQSVHEPRIDHPVLLARHGGSRAALKNGKNIPAVPRREATENPPIRLRRRFVCDFPQGREETLFRSPTDPLAQRWMRQYRLRLIPAQDARAGSRASRWPWNP